MSKALPIGFDLLARKSQKKVPSEGTYGITSYETVLSIKVRAAKLINPYHNVHESEQLSVS